MGLYPSRTTGEFFEKAAALSPVYQALEAAILERWPETGVRIQKSQISFDSKRPFAAAWIPPRKGLWGRPGPFLALTLYLHAPLDHPRVAARVEPYPGRWTHHLNLNTAEDVDAELLEWLGCARSWRDSI